MISGDRNKRTYRARLFSIAIFFVYTNNAAAQSTEHSRIDAAMQDVVRDETFNGSVLVAKNNVILYNSSFGFTDATKSTRLTPDYRFNIGSITKEFSSTALLQLRERGKLRLDDPVARYLPELPSWAESVKIGYLLNYTSGIPNVDWKRVRSDQDIYEGLRRITTLDFTPGTNYDYNNNNIFVRQLIVERLTGQTYKSYAENNIFRRCKIRRAYVTPIQAQADIASGFNAALIADKPDLPITGGAYFSTADMLKWSNCLNSRRVVGQASIASLGAKYDIADAQSSLGQAEYRNGKLIRHAHDGRAGSYEALLVSDLDTKITIILLGNSYRGKLFQIAGAIETALSTSGRTVRNH